MLLYVTKCERSDTLYMIISALRNLTPNERLGAEALLLSWGWVRTMAEV